MRRCDTSSIATAGNRAQSASLFPRVSRGDILYVDFRNIWIRRARRTDQGPVIRCELASVRIRALQGKLERRTDSRHIDAVDVVCIRR